MQNVEAALFYAKDGRFDKIEDQSSYIYGMRLRGFSPGCQPKEGFVMRLDDDSGKYHDKLVYNRRLIEQEVLAYELDYLTEHGDLEVKL